MASRGDIKAGRAYIELFVKSKLSDGIGVVRKQLFQLAHGVQYIGAAFKQVGGMMQGLGTAAMAPFLAALYALPDAVGPLKEIKNALANALGRPLMPLLIQVRDIVNQFAAWASQNGAVIRSVFQIAVAMVAVGTAIKLVGSLLITMATLIKMIGVGMGVLQGVVMFLTSPLGLIVGLLIACAAAWYKFTLGGQRAQVQVAKAMDAIKDDFASVADAIMGGRIELAWDIVLTGMEIRWGQFFTRIKDKWRELTTGFLASILESKWFTTFLSPETHKEFAKALRDTASGMTAESNAEQQRLLDRMKALKGEAARARAGFHGFIPPFDEKRTPVLSDPSSLLRGSQAMLGQWGKEDAVPILKRQELLAKRALEYQREMARRREAFRP